jgi:hypothetical protein
MATKRAGLKLQVVAPCTEDWDQMSGGDDIRFCGRCRQNVYNLGEMNESQVRELVQGPACVRFFARGDGTVVTRECTPMLEAARRRMVALAAGLLPLAVGFWGGVAWLRGKMGVDSPVVMGGIPARRVDPPPLMGEPALPEEEPEPPRTTKPPRKHLMGKPVAPRATMGEPMMGTPPAMTLGRMAPPPKKTR